MAVSEPPETQATFPLQPQPQSQSQSSPAVPPPSTTATTTSMTPQSPAPLQISPLATLQPRLYQRAWASVPHPTLPLLATAHGTAVTVFSLSTMSRHSVLERGHDRSVRSAAWMPPQKGPRAAAATTGDDEYGEQDDNDDGQEGDHHEEEDMPCLATSSFDGRAALWRWTGNRGLNGGGGGGGGGRDGKEELAEDVQATLARKERRRRDKHTGDEDERDRQDDDEDDGGDDNDNDEDEDEDWEFWVDFSGHENEVKCSAFSPSGQYLATCSRDKTVWVWEDVGARRADGDWETVSVLAEHDGDVKCVAWCPTDDSNNSSRHSYYSHDALASASYDGTVRVWREDADGEFVCVAVLEAGGSAGATVWGVQWEPQSQRARERRGANGRRTSRSPRLLTWSADGEVKVWTLGGEEEGEGEEEDAAAAETSGHPPMLGGPIPSTMRRSLHEEWTCTAALPRAHSRDVYSACWSAETGLVASTGSDGVIAVYAEDGEGEETKGEGGAVAVVATKDGDGDMDIASVGSGDADAAASSPSPPPKVAGTTDPTTAVTTTTAADKLASPLEGHDAPPPHEATHRDGWRVVATVEGGHGAYEINHVAWCKRFDKGASAGRGSQQGRRGDKGAREEMLVTTGDDGTVRAWTIGMPASSAPS